MKAKSYNFNICFYPTIRPKLCSYPLLHHPTPVCSSTCVSSMVSDSTSHSQVRNLRAMLYYQIGRTSTCLVYPIPHRKTRKKMCVGVIFDVFLKKIFGHLIYILEFSILCILNYTGEVWSWEGLYT